MDLLQKYLGKLKSVTHVHIICSSHSLAPNLSYNACLTPTLLILVLRLPALHTLVVNNCLIDHHVIPDSLRSCSLRVLVLNTSTSAQPRYYAPDVPLPSPLQYAPAVTAIEMRGTEYQSGLSAGLESCLFAVLQSIVMGPKNNIHSRQPRRLHLVCDCQHLCCLLRNVIMHLSIRQHTYLCNSPNFLPLDCP